MPVCSFGWSRSSDIPLWSMPGGNCFLAGNAGLCCSPPSSVSPTLPWCQMIQVWGVGEILQEEHLHARVGPISGPSCVGSLPAWASTRSLLPSHDGPGVSTPMLSSKNINHWGALGTASPPWACFSWPEQKWPHALCYAPAPCMKWCSLGRRVSGNGFIQCAYQRHKKKKKGLGSLISISRCSIN